MDIQRIFDDAEDRKLKWQQKKREEDETTRRALSAAQAFVQGEGRAVLVEIADQLGRRGVQVELDNSLSTDTHSKLPQRVWLTTKRINRLYLSAGTIGLVHDGKEAKAFYEGDGSQTYNADWKRGLTTALGRMLDIINGVAT